MTRLKILALAMVCSATISLGATEDAKSKEDIKLKQSTVVKDTNEDEERQPKSLPLFEHYPYDTNMMPIPDNFYEQGGFYPTRMTKYPITPSASYYYSYFYPYNYADRISAMPEVQKPSYTHYSYGIKGYPKFFDANNIYKEQSESLFWPFTNYRALPEEELRSPKHPENISGRTHKAGSMLVNTWANMYGPHNPTFTAPSFNERIMQRKANREAVILHQTRTQSAVMAEQYLSQYESKDTCFHQSFCQASMGGPGEDTTTDEQNAADEAIRVLNRMLSLVGKPQDRFPHVRQLIAAHNVGKETKNPTLCRWLFPCQPQDKTHETQARMTCKQSARLCPGISIACGLCAMVSPESCSVVCPVAALYCGTAGYTCAMESAMNQNPETTTAAPTTAPPTTPAAPTTAASTTAATKK